ncbi:MAG: septation protein A [Rhodospirillaceae bacterium]|nr:septation protein A [Rhodospirillaceae bacterium]
MTTPTAPKWIKPAVEFGPLVVFFIAFKVYDLRVATGVLMAATVVCVAIGYWTTRKISPMQRVTAVVVLLFGTLTLVLHDNSYVKMKPTVVQALFAIVLFGGAILRRPTLQYVLGEALKLNDSGWRQLTWRYAIFFTCMAILNEIIWRNFSEGFWVNFKLFGIVGLTLLFSLAQMPLMKRHMIETPGEPG